MALSLSTGERYWEGVDTELLDTAVFLCASICRDLLHRGIPFGLASNAAGARSAGSSILIPPGSSRGHLLKVLETLARVSVPWMEFYATLRTLAREVDADTGVAVIMTRQLKADWDAALALPQRSQVACWLSRKTASVLLRRNPAYSPAFRLIWVHRGISLERTLLTLPFRSRPRLVGAGAY